MSAPILLDDDGPKAKDQGRQKFRRKVGDVICILNFPALKEKLSELVTESGV